MFNPDFPLDRFLFCQSRMPTYSRWRKIRIAIEVRSLRVPLHIGVQHWRSHRRNGTRSHLMGNRGLIKMGHTHYKKMAQLTLRHYVHPIPELIILPGDLTALSNTEPSPHYHLHS